MRRRTFFYLLVLLLIWGTVDDLIVTTSTPDPSADTATSDNDQYLPAVRKLDEKDTVSKVLVWLPAWSWTTSTEPLGVPAGARLPNRTLHVPWSGNPLYLLMSLQR